METNRRNFLAILTAIVASGVAVPTLLSNPANAQVSTFPSLFGDICSHKVLFDNAIGNVRGWNPDGAKKIFFISGDSCVNPVNSVVLVNTKQANFVICAVDWLTNGGFEVNCNLAPSNFGELHYSVFNHGLTLPTAEPATVAPDVASAASGRIAANAGAAAPLTGEQLGSSPASNTTSTPASNTTSTP